MGFTFIASAENYADALGTTLDCTSSLNVQAGDLLVAWCKHEETNGTFAVANTGGGNAFTFDAGDEENHSNSDLNGSFGYRLSATAGATETFRMTTASKEFRGLIVWQFRPDSGDVVTKVAAAEGQGTGTSAASGGISPSGDDLVVVGGFAQYGDVTLSNRNINGVAADAFQDSLATDFSSWYRILTSGFSGGTASVTQSSSIAWICNVIAFKAAPVSVALTGTALASITESDIVAGGKTIIATVSESTIVPATEIGDISFQTFALSGTTDTTTLNITLPTVAADDIMLLEYTHRGSGTGTLGGAGGSGWTLKGSRTYSAGTFSAHLYYKRCDGSESGDALTVTELTNSCAGCVTLYRGCHTSGDPIEAFSSEDNASANETHAEITTLTDKAWVVLTVSGSPDVNVSSQTCTSPGALAERAERLNTSGTDTSISHASAVKASAGATGALTWAQTDGPSATFAYALKPLVTTPFDDARAAFIAGFDSAQSEGTGWDAEVKAKAAVTEVARTSDTVVTWTIAAQAGYNITAQETITGTIPASMLVSAGAVVATPTFTIDTSGGGGGSVVPVIQYQYRQRRA